MFPLRYGSHCFCLSLMHYWFGQAFSWLCLFITLFRVLTVVGLTLSRVIVVVVALGQFEVRCLAFMGLGHGSNLVCHDNSCSCFFLTKS